MHDEEVRCVNRKKKKRESLIIAILLLLVLTIGVGYASLSRSLTITGKSKISAQTWDIYFDESSISATQSDTTTVTTKPTVSVDSSGYKTQITYDVTLSQPGDYYEFTVNLVNNGSIAAELSENPTITTIDSDASKYFTYTVEEVTSSGNQTITKDNFKLDAASGSTPTKKTIKVRVEYKSDINVSDLQTVTKSFDNLTFELSFKQAS
jgi:hypothetical protein